MKRIILVVLLFIFTAQTARADDPPGAKLFGTYCVACHGAGGKGGAAPAIGAAQYLNAKDDAAITRLTSEGNISKGMPAWSKAKGGALSDDQIASIVAYLRSPATVVTAPAPAPSVPQTTNNANLIQTKLVVSQSAAADGESILNASLQQYSGYPIADAAVAFSRPTSWGILDLGTAKTGENGIATLSISEVPMSAREVVITFNGDKKFSAVTTKFALASLTETASSSDSLNLSGVHLSIKEPLLAPEGSLITPNPPLLPTVLFLLVVGSVWATYGLVFFQAYKIWKSRRSPAYENTLRNDRR